MQAVAFLTGGGRDIRVEKFRPESRIFEFSDQRSPSSPLLPATTFLKMKFIVVPLTWEVKIKTSICVP